MAEAATKVAGQMMLLKYSRQDEYEADRLGIRYMARAGSNPWGMVELLQHLNALSEGGGSSLGEMFSTHPLTTNRIENAKEIIRSDPKYNAYRPDRPDPRRRRFLQMRSRLQ
jgi:predicted Zn-dependent protease